VTRSTAKASSPNSRVSSPVKIWATVRPTGVAASTTQARFFSSRQKAASSRTCARPWMPSAEKTARNSESRTSVSEIFSSKVYR